MFYLISISVIQIVMMDDLLATNEISTFTALEDILDSIQILAKVWVDIIIHLSNLLHLLQTYIS